MEAIERGDTGASERLLPLVYEELRALADQRLAHERAGQTLQATALVHEASLRLIGREEAAAEHDRARELEERAERLRSLFDLRPLDDAEGGAPCRLPLAVLPLGNASGERNVHDLLVHQHGAAEFQRIMQDVGHPLAGKPTPGADRPHPKAAPRPFG